MPDLIINCYNVNDITLPLLSFAFAPPPFIVRCIVFPRFLLLLMYHIPEEIRPPLFMTMHNVPNCY